MRVSTTLSLYVASFLAAAVASAKGLESLSENNPETAAEEGAEKSSSDEGESGGESAAPKTPSATSKSLSQNLTLSTGFGWAIASKSSGDWKSNGASDLTVAYKIASLGANMPIFGSYRYAPVAVSGTEEDHSYRGVWEGHFFGARLHYGLNQTLRAVGAAELGYVISSLRPVDGLEAVEKHADNGVAFALGGGADWSISEKFAFSGGPKIHAAFGSFTIIQVGGSLSFLF